MSTSAPIVDCRTDAAAGGHSLHPVVRRRRTLRYAYGILRNRMEIRPAQREPIIRWLGYLKANGNSIGTICDLCAKSTSTQHFYNTAKQLLPPNDKVSDGV